MKKIITLAAAALCALTFALPAATPATAQSLSFGWGMNVGGPHRGWNGWDRPHNWDRPHFRNRARAGVSIDIGPVDIELRARGGSGWRGHVARCEDRFRSYDSGTDMYLGFDGDYHRCQL